MSLPSVSMSQLMDAGVHFGHQAHRWDPKMAPYLYGVRSGIHIIDLSKTLPRLRRALKEVRDVVASGGRVLFVGTKKHAQQTVADSAERCAQYFMNHRWLGGTLTNWETISKSIKRLRDLDEILEKSDKSGLTKKELLKLSHERHKLNKALGGIRNMGERPNLLFVIDTNREAIAVREAKCLGIPVVAITDSDCNPHEVDFPIPGNDDAQCSITLYCDLVAEAVLDGLDAANSGTETSDDQSLAVDTYSDTTQTTSETPAAATPSDEASPSTDPTSPNSDANDSISPEPHNNHASSQENDQALT